MQIADLWLEDLFKIYVGSHLALDRGPFQGRPTVYNAATFGNPTPQQIQQVIEAKLRLKKQQGDVAVLGYYIRFVNTLQGVRDESRRQALRNWIRFPRVRVADAHEYDSARHSLIMALSAYEGRLWQRRGPLAREAQAMGDRIAMLGAYSGALDSFNATIREITSLADESIIGGPAEVKMEIDFAVHRNFSVRTASPYPDSREGTREAVRAWNALFPRQRSAAWTRAGDLSNALQEKYEALHSMRGLTVPDI